MRFFKTQEGTRSLEAFSAAQGVELSYNETGQLVDRGETEGAGAILAMLTEDWGYPVVASELDPNDPVIEHRMRVHVPDGHRRLSHAARHADGRPRRGLHGSDGTVYTAGFFQTRSRSTAATGPTSIARTRSMPPSAHRPGPAWPMPRILPSSVSER